MDIRQGQYALITDDMERVLCRHGTDSENIDPVALFAGIEIELLKDTHSKVSVHVADKNTNFHDTIILGVSGPEKTILTALEGFLRLSPNCDYTPIVFRSKQ